MKLRKLLPLSLLLISLTACSLEDAFGFVSEMIDIVNDSSSSSFSSSESSGSSSKSNSSSKSSVSSEVSSNSSNSNSSQNNPWGGSKTTLQYTYEDYTKYNCYPLSSCPSIGSPKLLVIPVWFSDSLTYIAKSNIETIRSDIQKAYFGTESETGWHSVSTYYKKESYGKCNITGTVAPWYEDSNASSYYYDESTGASRTQSLVKKVVDDYFTKNTSDKRTNYDTDKDGYLDGVILIYASPDYDALNKSSAANMWAYCYWQQDTKLKSTTSPGVNAYFWASYDFMYGKAKAQTQTAKSTYCTGDTSNCNVDAHTYIHEMGHIFGLDDYYDYSDNGYSPAGGFHMQDCNVAGHDPYSVMALGWSSPYIPTSTATITINAFQDSGDLILLSPSFNGDKSPFDEYLLLEFYTNGGLNSFDNSHAYMGNYPTGSKTSGIRLWHVDARLVQYNSRSGSYSSTAITDPTKDNVTHMMSNTYYSKGYEDYISPLGTNYAEYNLLQLIRNSSSATYKSKSSFTASDLFVKGDTFEASSYSGQFKKSGGALNKGTALGWSFKVDSISSTSATITVTKK